MVKYILVLGFISTNVFSQVKMNLTDNKIENPENCMPVSKPSGLDTIDRGFGEEFIFKCDDGREIHARPSEFAERGIKFKYTVKMGGKEFVVDVPVDMMGAEAAKDHLKFIHDSNNMDKLSSEEKQKVEKGLLFHSQGALKLLVKEQSDEYKNKSKECAALKDEAKFTCREELEALQEKLAKEISGMQLKKNVKMSLAKLDCAQKFEKLINLEISCENSSSFGPSTKVPAYGLLNDSVKNKFKDISPEQCTKMMEAEIDKLGKDFELVVPNGEVDFTYTCENKYLKGLDKNGCKKSSVNELTVRTASTESCGPGINVCQISYSCTEGPHKGSGSTLCEKKGDQPCEEVSVEDCINAGKDFSNINPVKNSNSPKNAKGNQQ